MTDRPHHRYPRHGPGRAAGVPIIAGLVMHHGVLAGRVEHKVAGAVRFVGDQEYVYPPAIWTDANVAGGRPLQGVIDRRYPAGDLCLGAPLLTRRLHQLQAEAAERRQ